MFSSRVLSYKKSNLARQCRHSYNLLHFYSSCFTSSQTYLSSRLWFEKKPVSVQLTLALPLPDNCLAILTLQQIHIFLPEKQCVSQKEAIYLINVGMRTGFPGLPPTSSLNPHRYPAFLSRRAAHTSIGRAGMCCRSAEVQSHSLNSTLVFAIQGHHWKKNPVFLFSN